MTKDVSLIRLGFLRAGYLLLVVGLGLSLWPSVLNPAKTWELMHGVVMAMLTAMSLLAIVGLRYPLQMLPLLFFELTWKTVWLLRMAWPLAAQHRMDADTSETVWECLLAVVFVAGIPLPYVIRHYVLKPGDPWFKRRD